jgi:hemolysin III
MMPTDLPQQADVSSGEDVSKNELVQPGQKKREQTLGEEIANSITHGVGLVLAVIGLVVLVVKAATTGEMLHVVSSSVFGVTLVMLYLASTLYHSVQTPRIKRWLRIFDHTAIYLLIAGTYTPFMLVSLQGGWGWTLFAVIWGLALVGVLYKLLAFGRFQKLSLALYLGMGWLAVLAIEPLVQTLPPGGLALMAAGGFAYTFGVLFYVLQRRRFFHTVWHLFVMGGSACHYAAVLLFVVPSAPMA